MRAKARSGIRPLPSWLPAFAIAALLTACGTAPPRPQPPSGTVELNPTLPTQGPGGSGTGTLFLNGRAYPFAMMGVGVGGDAIAVLQTNGEAYRIGDFARFRGTYRQAAGDRLPRSGAGGLWLENANGVLLHLQPPPDGRLPSIGSDGVFVQPLD